VPLFSANAYSAIYMGSPNPLVTADIMYEAGVTTWGVYVLNNHHNYYFCMP